MSLSTTPPENLDALVFQRSSKAYRAAQPAAKTWSAAEGNDVAGNDVAARPLLLLESLGLGLSVALQGSQVLYVTARFLLAP